MLFVSTSAQGTGTGNRNGGDAYGLLLTGEEEKYPSAQVALTMMQTFPEVRWYMVMFRKQR